MTARTPRSEPAVDHEMSRRAAIVGGASAAAAALLATSSADAHTTAFAGEAEAWAIPAELTDHVSGSSVDVRPLGTENDVRVEVAPDAKGDPSDFGDGALVSVVLLPWSGEVQTAEFGSKGTVQTQRLIKLIVGKPSEAPALQG